MSNILTGMLESLKLETISQVYSSIAIDAEKHSKTYTDYLKDLASIEIEERIFQSRFSLGRNAKEFFFHLNMTVPAPLDHLMFFDTKTIENF